MIEVAFFHAEKPLPWRAPPPPAPPRPRAPRPVTCRAVPPRTPHPVERADPIAIIRKPQLEVLAMRTTMERRVQPYSRGRAGRAVPGDVYGVRWGLMQGWQPVAPADLLALYLLLAGGVMQGAIELHDSQIVDGGTF